MGPACTGRAIFLSHVGLEILVPQQPQSETGGESSENFGVWESVSEATKSFKKIKKKIRKKCWKRCDFESLKEKQIAFPRPPAHKPGGAGCAQVLRGPGARFGRAGIPRSVLCFE